MPRAWSPTRSAKRRKRMIRWAVAAFALAWLVQLVVLQVRLGELRWSEYWATRAFYRPGLIAFEQVAEPWLPGHFFSPFSRTGAMTGFAFASGLYALGIVPPAMVVAAKKR